MNEQNTMDKAINDVLKKSLAELVNGGSPLEVVSKDALQAIYIAGVKAATPPPGHIIDDAGNVRKVRMQAVFVGGTVPCAIPLKPGETVMALEAAEAARKEGKP